QENFVWGFKIRVGEFHEVQPDVADLLVADDLYKSSIHASEEVRSKYWPIYEHIHKHKCLQGDGVTIPLKWRHDMIWSFLCATLAWLKNNKDKFAEGERPRIA
ncbi:hypothetical protein EK21DRAFT_75693, partial [Setomelanomma holmii]